MRERDSQISGDVSVDIDPGLDESASQENTESSGGVGSRLRERAGSVVSGRSVVVALVLMIVTTLVVGAIPLLGIVGELLGIVTAGFLYGLGTDTKRYVELVLAGALAGTGSVLLGNFVLALAGNGLTLLAIGAIGGGVASAVGHYFGRDLRRGLTQDLGELEN